MRADGGDGWGSLRNHSHLVGKAPERTELREKVLPGHREVGGQVGGTCVGGTSRSPRSTHGRLDGAELEDETPSRARGPPGGSVSMLSRTHPERKADAPTPQYLCPGVQTPPSEMRPHQSQQVWAPTPPQPRLPGSGPGPHLLPPLGHKGPEVQGPHKGGSSAEEA